MLPSLIDGVAPDGGIRQARPSPVTGRPAFQIRRALGRRQIAGRAAFTLHPQFIGRLTLNVPHAATRTPHPCSGVDRRGHCARRETGLEPAQQVLLLRRGQGFHSVFDFNKRAHRWQDANACGCRQRLISPRIRRAFSFSNGAHAAALAAYFAAPSWMHAASFVERTKMRPPLSTGVVQHLPSMALKRPSSL